MDLNLLKTFLKLSELGSFTKAALVLKQPKSRVSRGISRLEEDLGIQLVNRTTRHTSLTNAGKELFQRTRHLMEELEQEILSIAEEGGIQGPFRITAPEDMAQTILGEILSEFTSLYPKVEVQSVITNEFLNLNRENIDLALRVGRLKDSNLIQRKLRDVYLIMVGSREYLTTYGRPKNFEDLVHHKLLQFKEFDFNKIFGLKEKKLVPTFQSDSFSMLSQMAKRGNGLAILPDFYGKRPIESGELERIFPFWRGKKDTIHMVFPSKKNLSKKTRAFIDLAIKLQNS